MRDRNEDRYSRLDDENTQQESLGGSQYSGILREIGAGELGTSRQIPFLRAENKGRAPGMASVHVHVSEVTPANPAVRPTQRLQLFVGWQHGRAGGECLVDATHGTIFSVSASDSVELRAQVVPNEDGVSFVQGATYRVEASVHWSTSISPKNAQMVNNTLTLGAGVVSTPRIIPAQSSALMVLSDVPASLATLEARFFSNTAGVGAPMYTTLNPFANGTPIVNGAQAVIFFSPIAMRITPVYDLWL